MKSQTIKLAGAYIAFLVGSGFASGQEILQFYTGYGVKSFAAVIISAVLFFYVSITLVGEGYKNRENPEYSPFRDVLGSKLGKVYEVFLTVYLFLIVVVMISGSGALVSRNFGINHYVGSVLLAVMVFVSVILGLEKLIDTVGLIGPAVVCLAVLICIISVVRNGIDFSTVEAAVKTADIHTPAESFVSGGILYAAYNLICAIMFFNTLGGQTVSRKQAKATAVLGTVGILTTIVMMDAAFLGCPSEIAGEEIPTMYLALSISKAMGSIFFVALFLAIYASAAPKVWAICDTVLEKDCSRKKYMLTAFLIILAAGAFGLLPFSKLIGIVYPLSGIMGLIYILLLVVHNLRERVK